MCVCRLKLRASCALDYELVYTEEGKRTRELRAKEAFDLADVGSLVFKRGEMTTGKRTRPVAQLNCVGGDARAEMAGSIESVECRNVGRDDRGEVQWKCDAKMDPDVKVRRRQDLCDLVSCAPRWRVL